MLVASIAALNLPAAHDVHELLEELPLHLPAAQLRQKAPPELGLYLPCVGSGKRSVRIGQKFPAGVLRRINEQGKVDSAHNFKRTATQDRQALEDVLPAFGLYRPCATHVRGRYNERESL